MSTKSPDELAVDTLRALAMDAVEAANSGHPGAPLGLAPLGWTIFSRLRKHDPSHPEWMDRDRFVLSAGHASMLQYGLLHLAGYDLPLDELKRFRQWGSKTPGHPEYGHTPGVETTTGPLGQGFATSVGMAMAEQHLAARFNRPEHALFDHHTWVIASDGDLMEGVSAEAASLAGHLGLGKLIVFWDDNRITIDGSTEIAFTEDVLKRFEAYGWHTLEVEDGNRLEALEAAGRAAMKETARPSLVRVRTVIGYPAPKKQGTSSAHGSPLGAAEVAATKQAMGWPNEAFVVPTEMDRVRESLRMRGADAYAAWEKALGAYEAAHPALASELKDVLAGRLPKDWESKLPSFPADAKGMATRKASGAVLAALSDAVPNLVGGSADLAGSNNSYQKGKGDFPVHGGGTIPRNVHWGIREHAMASAVNGLALHGGVVPYAATFLVFSDYMRPAIRLAALMNVPARYIFTHDSIGLGEDGPTHQPVEHLAALRAIPGMTVIRPGDANEVAEGWRAMLTQRGPVALVLTRQDLPTYDRTAYGKAEGLHRGAYVFAEATGGAPKAILLATGSELSIAVRARETLEQGGVPTRVVSVPCFEFFAAQDQAYRDSVLQPSVRVRVAIEAGIRMGWERWVGDGGAYVTLDRFGASAPFEVLYKELGITAEAAVARVRELV
ncbi:MAG: transketolase [Polyangiales bacterium]